MNVTPEWDLSHRKSPRRWRGTMMPQRSTVGQLVQGGGPAQRGKRSGRGSPNPSMTLVLRAIWGTADADCSPEHGHKHWLTPPREQESWGRGGGGHGKKEQRTEDLVATLLPGHHREHKKQWTGGAVQRDERGTVGVSLGVTWLFLKLRSHFSSPFLPDSLPRLGCFTAY